MHTIKLHAAFAVAGLFGSLSLAACDLDVPDLNNPGLAQLQDTPTAALVESAATGLFIGGRANIASENGYVLQLGVLGREAYNFDGADPRFITELLTGPLNQASPFGGNFWPFPYTNIRVANIILAGLDKVAEFSATDKALISGFAHTMQAIDLLQIIVTHDTNGASIDTSGPLGSPLGPIVSKDATYAEIVRLLEQGATELGGVTDPKATFPFAMSSGFHNADPKLTLDTPAGFRKFNRAIKARVAVYTKDYAGALAALGASFLDDTSTTIPMGLGAYYPYSTKSGDVVNNLINANIYVHPALATDAKNGALTDLRFTSKVDTADKPGANSGFASSFQFSKLYSSPGSPVALIRNEELILIKAEALFFSGMTGPAIDELNLVRVQSGGLPVLAPTADPTTFTNELLYERRYSLMFEGGHRWIDLRRFGQKVSLDTPESVANVRYPIPQAECDARPGEAACTLGSM